MNDDVTVLQSLKFYEFWDIAFTALEETFEDYDPANDLIPLGAAADLIAKRLVEADEDDG